MPARQDVGLCFFLAGAALPRVRLPSRSYLSCAQRLLWGPFGGIFRRYW